MTKSFRIPNLVAALLAAGMLFLPTMASAQPPDPELINPHKVPLTPEVERIIEERMRDVAMCWHAWLEASLPFTEEERIALKSQFEEDYAREVENAKDVAFFRANMLLPEGFPVYFAREGGATPLQNLVRIWSLEKVLTRDRFRRYLRLPEEAYNWRTATYKQYTLAVLDSHVILSDEQWSALEKDKDFETLVQFTPHFALNPEGGYFPYYSFSQLPGLTRKDILDPTQMLWIEQQGTQKNYPRQNVKLNSTTRPELNREVEEQLLQGRQGIRGYLEERITRLTKVHALSEQQVLQLRTAAKGVAVRHRDTVYVDTMRRFDILDEMARQGTFILSQRELNSVFTPGDPLEDPLWLETLSAVLGQPGQPSARRAARVQEARNRAVVSLFSHELYLTGAQQDQMLACFSEVLPPLSMINPTQEHLRDITWIVHVLVLADEQRLREILNEPQFKSWQHMKAMLPVVHEPAPIVTIRLKNNGLLKIPLRIPNAKSMPE